MTTETTVILSAFAGIVAGSSIFIAMALMVIAKAFERWVDNQ
jgi:hypothetical protein